MVSTTSTLLSSGGIANAPAVSLACPARLEYRNLVWLCRKFLGIYRLEKVILFAIDEHPSALWSSRAASMRIMIYRFSDRGVRRWVTTSNPLLSSGRSTSINTQRRGDVCSRVPWRRQRSLFCGGGNRSTRHSGSKHIMES